MPSETLKLLGVPAEVWVQGLIGALLFFWAWKDARTKAKAAVGQLQPNPIVAGVSMAWDRDMQERLLQLMERVALASEAQASHQEVMANEQQREMNKRIDSLLAALADAEKAKGKLNG